MRKRKVVAGASLMVFMLAGCGQNGQEEGAAPEPETGEEVVEAEGEGAAEPSGETEAAEAADAVTEETGATDGEAASSGGELSAHSSEEVEYARVWLQLGPNPEIDALDVRKIPEGEPVNPDDETSARYPEDVIQLSGTRLVDGSVTYSGNGDGTVSVYNVPLRWESPAPVGGDYMRKLTEEIVENTKLVAIDPGDEADVLKYIKLLEIQQ